MLIGPGNRVAGVIERFRATEPGWQSRINEVLREHLPVVSR
jgi:uncharacterized protein (DUF4415 family)